MGIFRQFPYSNFHEMNMDEIIKIMRQMQDEWAATKAEWASYKDFIDNYFANLDVSEEVLAALRVFAADGTLNQIMDPTIATETAAWLAEHITPTTPPVDSSLTVAGAAADAKVVGVTGGFIRFKGVLPANADLTALEVGVYAVTDAVAESIADLPVDTGGNLIITAGSAAGTQTQIYHSSAYNNCETYYRNGTSGEWYTTQGLNGMLTAEDTFAATTKVGVYGVPADVALAISDAPTKASGTLFVRKSTRGSTIVQIYCALNKKMYWRPSVSEPWYLLFGYAGLLTASDTFANMNEIGIYGVPADVAQAISDAPVAAGGNLIVLKSDVTARRTQIYIANNRALYWRNASDSWSKAFGYMGNIAGSQTFNTLTDLGIYTINNSNAAAIADSPSKYGGIVLVLKSVESGTPIQVFYDVYGQIYWRYGTADWRKLSMAARNAYFCNTCVIKPVDLSNKGIFIFGDSISTTTHGGFTWSSVLCEEVNSTEYNYAVGSAAFKHHDETNLRIIDQVNAVPVADWDKCDICFIQAGTNDANYNTSGPDLRTAVWNVISAIRSHAPNARIIFITPLQRFDEYYNSKLPVIAGAICNVAAVNNCSVINGFDIPIPTYTDDWIHEATDNDGLHPAAAGKRILAHAVLNAVL